MLWSCVLFDLGDTLIDSHPLAADAADQQVVRAFELWLRRRSMRAGDEFSPDERARIASIEGQRLLAAIAAGLADVQAAWWTTGREAPPGSVFAKLQAEIAAASGLVASRDELEEIYVKARLARQRPLPGAIDLLRTLGQAGLRRGLVSNCVFARQLMDAHLRLHGLAPLLEVTVYSSEVGWRKPRPEPFLAAAGRLTTPPAAIVYVGNDPAADLAGAVEAGLGAIWFWGHDRSLEGRLPGPPLGPGTWPDLEGLPELAATLTGLAAGGTSNGTSGGDSLSGRSRARLYGAAQTLAEVGDLLLAAGQ